MLDARLRAYQCSHVLILASPYLSYLRFQGLGFEKEIKTEFEIIHNCGHTFRDRPLI